MKGNDSKEKDWRGIYYEDADLINIHSHKYNIKSYRTIKRLIKISKNYS